MHCFVKGTQILMEDGSYKKIEDVAVGDRIMSYDTEAGRYIGSSVVKTTKNDAGKYYSVNESMKITPGHVLNVSGAWKLSEEMKVNDFLINAAGERIPITSIREISEPVEVFNLITEEPNNFFAENFLVHNENALPAHKDKGLYMGMKVTLADGREVAVENVKAGDRILAYDGKNKRYAISTVKQTAKQTVGKTLMINEKLRLGTKHQFYNVPPGGKPSKKSSK
jgi:intein/homing endonuclease